MLNVGKVMGTLYYKYAKIYDMIYIIMSWYLERRGQTGDLVEVLDSTFDLTEERLVHLEVLLGHVVKAVAAVDEHHDKQHDVT